VRKKIWLLLILALVVSGCTAKYTIKITKDLGVEETIVALQDAQFFNQYENSSAQRVISFLVAPHLDYLNSNNYIVRETIGPSFGGVVINNSFDTIEKFKETSKFTEQYADEWEYITNGNEVTLRIVGAFNADEYDQTGRYLIEEGEINIQLPFKVISHNADSYDEATNTYTWLIEKPGVEREITITFDKSKIEDAFNPLYLIIGGIIIVILIFMAWIFGKMSGSKARNDLNN